jgi:hypothetical protein
VKTAFPSRIFKSEGIKRLLGSKHGVPWLMRYPRSILNAIVLAGAVGLATVALALPPSVTVTSPVKFEIMRNGQSSGKISLAVGTTLEVDNVDGEYVLVHFRGLKGRVPAKATDLAAGDAVAAPENAESAQVSAPAPAAPPSEKLAVSTSKSVARTVDAKPAAAPHVSVERGDPKIGGAMLVGILGFFLFMIVANWRLFTKAGQPGWAILVPIYNVIVWLQIGGKPFWWLLLYFIPVVNLIVAVLTVFGIADNFGKGKAFGLGLLLVPFIFVPVLAFGDAQYAGSRR